MSTLITKEFKIGKGNSTVTMKEIPQNESSVPGGKGAADYERLTTQYPDSPLFNSSKFVDAKTYASYYYSTVFGREGDADGLVNFEAVEGSSGFPNSGVAGNIRKFRIDFIPDVPVFGINFPKDAVISTVNPNVAVEPTDSMPLTPYYPNTSSPSTTLSTGLADQQGASAGTIAPSEVPSQAIKQFGVGGGSQEKPHLTTLEIASRMSVADV